LHKLSPFVCPLERLHNYRIPTWKSTAFSRAIEILEEKGFSPSAGRIHQLWSHHGALGDGIFALLAATPRISKRLLKACEFP